MRTPASGRGDACWCVPLGKRAIWRPAFPSAHPHTVPLALGSLEHDLYGNGLPDPVNYGEVYERELLVELVERRIESDCREEIRRVFKMWRQGYTWEEIAAELMTRSPRR